MSLQDLKDSIDSEIESELDDLIEFPRQRDDKLTEIGETWVPDSHTELAGLLNEDHSFAQVDDEGLLPKNPSVWDIIQLSVREYLVGYAHEEGKRQVDEFEDMKSDLEIDGFQVGVVTRNYKPTGSRYYIYRDLDDEDLTEAEKEGTHNRSIDPDHNAPYQNEVLIKAYFQNEVEAWKWLEKNLEEVQEKLK